MFNMGSQSNISRYFADYRTENHMLLTRAKKIKEFLSRFKKFGHLETQDIAGNGFLGFNSQLKDAVESLDVNIGPSIVVIEKLIENLEKEKKDLDKYFDQLKHSSIEAIRQIEALLINYNKNQYDFMQELNSYIPNIIELTERAIAMEEEKFSKGVGKFLRMYEDLVFALGKNAQKYSLYENIESVIVELEKYRGGFNGEFMQNLSGKAKIFANNYYVTAQTLGRDLLKWKEKSGRKEDKNKTYENVEDSEKEKLDKYFKKALETLFAGIEKETVDGNEFEIKKKIGEIIKIES